MAIDDKRQGGPAITACPYAAQIRGPTSVGYCSHRRQGLNPWPEANSALSDLPALELEDTLHRIFIKTKQPGHCPVAKGWILLNHGLDGLGKSFLYLRHCIFDRFVIHRASWHIEPAAQLGNRDV